jgi:hypothetical protein
VTPEHLCDSLLAILNSHGFSLHHFEGPQVTAMGAWFVELRSSSFAVVAGQDRAGDMNHICVGRLAEFSQRKGRVGRQPLCRIRGFLTGDESNALFENEASQIDWLRQNLSKVLDDTMLSSSEFRDWVVADSRRMFRRESTEGGEPDDARESPS